MLWTLLYRGKEVPSFRHELNFTRPLRSKNFLNGQHFSLSISDLRWVATCQFFIKFPAGVLYQKVTEVWVSWKLAQWQPYFIQGRKRLSTPTFHVYRPMNVRFVIEALYYCHLVNSSTAKAILYIWTWNFVPFAMCYFRFG